MVRKRNDCFSNRHSEDNGKVDDTSPSLPLRRRWQWDVCKSPGFPSNRVAAGQVDPPAVRIAMVCSLFACRLSASEAFLFLSGALCWVFSNACTKEEHLMVFFVASDRRRAGVTRRRRSLVDCATPPRPLSKKQKSKSLGLHNLPACVKN